MGKMDNMKNIKAGFMVLGKGFGYLFGMFAETFRAGKRFIFLISMRIIVGRENSFWIIALGFWRPERCFFVIESG